MRVEQHWLDSAERMASAHCTERPSATPPDTLVIHCISLPPGQFATGCIEDLFLGRLDSTADPSLAELAEVQVSSHLLIDRDGQIRQFVPFDHAAWHAGESRLGSRQAVNDFSIGIELEGLPELEFTDSQYQTLAEVTEALFAAYPDLAPGRIVGHCDIAPHRKTDPGRSFDWNRYFSLLKS